MECIRLILSDYYRVWPKMKGKSKMFQLFHLCAALFLSASFMTTFWFRTVSSFPPPLSFCFSLIYKWVNFLTGIQLPIGTKVGKCLFFPHFSCIIISKRTVIGDNCTIFQGVTLGKTIQGCPCIGDNVVICANSTIVGNVNIGNNAVIGAGSVVIRDVPEGAVVVGNPAKIISYNGVEVGKEYR